jgi:hypothetical protein
MRVQANSKSTNPGQSEEQNMAEQITRSGPGKTPHSETLRSFSEQAIEAGREFKDKGADFVGTSVDNLKGVSDLANNAKKMAGQATETIKEAVLDRKDGGASYVGSLAEAMRRAGREFDNDLPLAGTYIRKAASQVENVAGSIRMGDFKNLVRNAQSFARRQPTAFVGLTALAGFAAVRFLKSSSSAVVSARPHGSPGAG